MSYLKCDKRRYRLSEFKHTVHLCRQMAISASDASHTQQRQTLILVAGAPVLHLDPNQTKQQTSHVLRQSTEPKNTETKRIKIKKTEEKKNEENEKEKKNEERTKRARGHTLHGTPTKRNYYPFTPTQATKNSPTRAGATTSGSSHN